MNDTARLASACAEAMWSQDHASRGLGMQLMHVAPGQAVLTMRITQAMVNGHGMCHGGFIFTLADSAFAFACNSHNERAVAQHCAITYIRPARLGEELRAEATERVRSGRSGITDVRVLAADGALIAEFRGHSRALGKHFFPQET